MTQELIATSRHKPDLPPIVREAYSISNEATVEYLSGGLVNDTMLVNDQGEATIMRRLSQIDDSTMIEDTEVIGRHLQQYGWEAPSNLPTVTGSTHVRDDGGQLWHRLQFIDSDGKTPTQMDTDLAGSAGTMIGNWHRTMRGLDYAPRFGLDHFHDTDWIATKLARQVPFLPDTTSRELAKDILQAYVFMPAEAEATRQVIHGDPKLDNMLFRGGRPFTLIDFDTVMLDSPWTDVGDFLRSLTGKLLHTGDAEPGITAFVGGYRETSELAVSPGEATGRALHATGRIALELGMRYLSDIVDPKKYFSWDPSRHVSRRDNHFERASLQFAVARYALEAA